MRLILLLAVAPLLVPAQYRNQYPNRPAAHAPGVPSRGMPVQALSAAHAPAPPAPLGLRGPGVGFTGINPGALRSHSFGHRDRRGAPIGYYAAPYFYSSYGDYGSSLFDPNAYSAPEEPNISFDATANLLGEQIQRLTAQVEQLRSEQQQQQQASAPPVNASGTPQEAPPETPITVVLRDGRRLQVASYAVMDRVFWDFSRQPARRIPLANIDVAASTKATEAAGGEFPELGMSR